MQEEHMLKERLCNYTATAKLDHYSGSQESSFT